MIRLLAIGAFVSLLPGCGAAPPDPAAEKRLLGDVEAAMVYEAKYGSGVDFTQLSDITPIPRPFGGHAVICAYRRAPEIVRGEKKWRRVLVFDRAYASVEPVIGDGAAFRELWDRAGCWSEMK
ncbi:MAG: hypothetical protein ABIR02_08225 [Novosphingobium sp.]